jgi:hypothetical protein
VAISEYAFSKCTSLKAIIIPEGVTFIGNYVFAGCAALENLVVPERFQHLVDDLTIDFEMEDDNEIGPDVD